MKNEKFIPYWQKQQKKGRWRYILTRGMLLYGGIYMLFWSFYLVTVVASVNYDEVTATQISNFILTNTVVNLVLAIAFGWLLGALLWKTKEKRYARIKPKENRITSPWQAGFPNAKNAPGAPRKNGGAK